MADGPAADGTAVRVALWRAMHVLVDAPPHVLEDEVGLQLADPGDGWRDRPDMHPAGTGRFRAAIVARARFIEDLVVEQAGRGFTQYVEAPAADRAGLRMAESGARAAGTPFISFYTPDEMLALAREAGFKDARQVAGTWLGERYFAGRADGLRPSSGEDLLVATT
jgi:leucine carboxyl methyltransferase